MVSRPENGWASGSCGFASLSVRFGGMAELERQRVASAQAAITARRFESCCLRLSRSGVVELGRRAVVTRESAGSSPAAGALPALVVEAVMTPGPQPGGCGFESRRGCSLSRTSCWSTSR